MVKQVTMNSVSLYLVSSSWPLYSFPPGTNSDTPTTPIQTGLTRRFRTPTRARLSESSKRQLSQYIRCSVGVSELETQASAKKLTPGLVKPGLGIC